MLRKLEKILESPAPVSVEMKDRRDSPLDQLQRTVLDERPRIRLEIFLVQDCSPAPAPYYKDPRHARALATLDRHLDALFLHRPHYLDQFILQPVHVLIKLNHRTRHRQQFEGRRVSATVVESLASFVCCRDVAFVQFVAARLPKKKMDQPLVGTNSLSDCDHVLLQTLGLNGPQFLLCCKHPLENLVWSVFGQLIAGQRDLLEPALPECRAVAQVRERRAVKIPNGISSLQFVHAQLRQIKVVNEARLRDSREAGGIAINERSADKAVNRLEGDCRLESLFGRHR